MKEPKSITQAILAFQEEGDESQFQLIWDRFFDRLCRLIRPKIFKQHRRKIDAEDLASLTLMELVNGLRKGSFQYPFDRESLWRLLAIIAARRTCSAMRMLSSPKHGGPTRGHSGFGEAGIQAIEASFIQSAGITDDEEDDINLLITTELSDLLETLPREDWRQIAIMKFAGHTNKEITDATGILSRTLERKLETIRTHWRANLAAE